MKQFYGPGLKLQEFLLWADLQAKEIDELLEIVTIVGFRSGEILFDPDSSPDHLYLLQ